ncbi:MAG: cytochrome-c peroxidase [Pedobacter sp.]|nr:MAG: cytochrome-c peroxidase [Pedobacter sp.]
MKLNKAIFGVTIVFSVLLLVSFKSFDIVAEYSETIDSLRKLYTQPSSSWPKPTVDKSVVFDELAPLPQPSIKASEERILLGKTLFFDSRLSSSNQISCATCHKPELSWTDGLQVSIGHDKALNTRNSPTIENVWFYNKLFWDGRANNLEEQAAIPLTSEIEMHQDMKLLPGKLKKVKGYAQLFKKAFGDREITSERILASIADFQRTIVSGRSKFDQFLEGDSESLNNEELLGLHLFRTKARCMNCHHGALLTDNEFHNLGLSNFGKKNQDLGLYNATKNPNDAGKFKTPSLRNVMNTGPWFHDGSVKTMDSLMLLYNMGMPFPAVTMAQLDDPLLPKNDRLLKGIRLSRSEMNAIIAFLGAISVKPAAFEVPKLPR